MTPLRVAAAERVGAAAVYSLYGAIECGVIGHSCLRPTAVDEVHLHGDLHAIIQPGSDAPIGALPADALLVTTLRRSARLILLNACLGDQATIDQRQCFCPLQSYGWHTHLRGIHSFEKLTGMGMTFADAELTPVLDQVLPARFGGDPTDYQLIEGESGDGDVRLRLVVDRVWGRSIMRHWLIPSWTPSLASRRRAVGWPWAGALPASCASTGGSRLRLLQERSCTFAAPT